MVQDPCRLIVAELASVAPKRAWFVHAISRCVIVS